MLMLMPMPMLMLMLHQLDMAVISAMDMVIERAMGMSMGMGMGIANMVMDTILRSVTARPVTPTPLAITTSAAATTTTRGAARSTVATTGTAIAMANQLQGGWQEQISRILSTLYLHTTLILSLTSSLTNYIFSLGLDAQVT